MKLFCLGINHKTAPIALREKFALSDFEARANFSESLDLKELPEHVLLSTCNRTEVYGVSANADIAILHIKSLLSQMAHVSSTEIESMLYEKKDVDAVKHLYSVACGLDSQIMGETEILGQVKDAYQEAHQSQKTGKVLNTLFQRSFKVGKQARTQTEIGMGKVSIASIAVDLSKKIFYRFQDKAVLVLGAGNVARQLCEALQSQGLHQLFFTNRTEGKVQDLINAFGGQYLAWEDLDLKASGFDIMIASTSSKDALIEKHQVEQWMHARQRKAMFIIDLGLPRNIDPLVNEISDVYVYNLDDLSTISDENLKGRKIAAKQCEAIIERASDLFIQWFNQSQNDRASSGQLKG